jgi:small-conductance mechanosensitive channel
MWLGVWLAMLAFATLFTLLWAVGETRIPMATTISTFAWGWLAFRSAEITKHTDSGAPITTADPTLQYFAGFMATLSFLGLLLWLYGDFPPDDDLASEDDPVGG